MKLKIKNAFKNENLMLFLYLTALVSVFVLNPFCLEAAGNPFDKVVDKFDNLKDTIFSVAKILAVIGIIIGGIKKVLGHPDAWTWLWSSGLGAFIIFSADAIVTWLGE